MSVQRQSATSFQWGHLRVGLGKYRLILGPTIESVRDLFLKLPHSTPKIYKPSMTRPCLACSSVSHNQGNGQIGQRGTDFSYNTPS